MTFLLVCVCGGLGAITRFVVNTSVQRWWERLGLRLFPLSTMVINMIATFCAGVAIAAYTYGTVGDGPYTLFVAGFLGGFSTLSTAINESMSLVRSRHPRVAALYLALTMIVPLCCVAAGWAVGSLGA